MSSNLLLKVFVIALSTLLFGCGGSGSSTSSTEQTEDLALDSDNDGVMDADDAFPLDANEWSDNDADGLGDNADSDDDNDTMPDDYELLHGLNPLLDDSADDLDNDGVSNAEEFNQSTDPNDDQSVPVNDPPTVSLGADFSIYNDQVLNLTGAVGGDGPLSHQWQLVSGAPVSFATDTAASTVVTYTPTMKTENFVFELMASNDTGSASDTITVTVKDRIYEALKVGNPALLPTNAAELEQRIQNVVAIEQSALVDLHNDIFSADAITYDPTRNSRTFSLISLSSAQALIVGSNDALILASASDKNDQRTVAFGHNVVVQANNGTMTTFEKHLKKTIDWLLVPHDLSVDENVKVATLLLSNGDMSKTETWLGSQYPDMTFTRCTDEAQLNVCLSDAHLIITGSNTSLNENAITSALSQATSNKQSLLYTHNGSWNSTVNTNPVLRYFGVQTEDPGNAGNFYSQDMATWSSATDMRNTSGVLGGITNLVRRFEANSFGFTIDTCHDTNCAAYSDEFSTTTENLRRMVKGFDESVIDIFTDQDNYLIEKHLLLLADKYRESIRFPMSIDSTPTLTFLKAYFADRLVYSSRLYNPVQADLGNFSRTNFDHITPTSQVVNMLSRQHFRAAGVYALPGQTFTVTRTDGHSSVNANIYINTQRESSTQHLTTNGYNRPKVLQTHHLPIAAGETIYLTSPYGGPVQIEFEDEGTNMTFNFTNIGQHPYWQPGVNDNDFLNTLAADAYDWAEIASEHFEIHSSRTKMLSTLNQDSRWDTPSEIEYFLTKYHHNYARIEGGFEGENIDVVDEIHDFATTNGLTMASWSRVQHFNADQQACGYGCSGNPYDAAWEFSVLGHGDLHEVGHTYEDDRFRFNGFDGHSTTNFYSYYAKSRGEDEDAVAHECQSLKFSDYNGHLQAGDDMANLSYTGWNYSAALVVEMMMHAEDSGVLDNGWHLIPRLHILSRNFNENDDNDSEWADSKDNLGFGTLTRTEAINLDNNSWLLIAASYATGLDYRPFFDLVGQSYTSEASSQVASFAYPAVESVFFLPATDNDYCRTLIQPKISY